MVVHSEDASENAKVNLTRILSEMRIDFEYQIIVANGEDFWEIMERESAKSDLVMIGLAPPKTEEDFETYYSRLKNRSQFLQTKIFVLAAQDIKFEEVLR